jgi:hypothetical protein
VAPDFHLCSAESIIVERLGLQKAAHYSDFLHDIKECCAMNFAAIEYDLPLLTKRVLALLFYAT